jgi:hypothetical protein
MTQHDYMSSLETREKKTREIMFVCSWILPMRKKLRSHKSLSEDTHHWSSSTRDIFFTWKMRWANLVFVYSPVLACKSNMIQRKQNETRQCRQAFILAYFVDFIDFCLMKWTDVISSGWGILVCDLVPSLSWIWWQSWWSGSHLEAFSFEKVMWCSPFIFYDGKGMHLSTKKARSL